MATNTTTITYAILGGVIPTLLWLWFWLREDNKINKEPRGLIFFCFIAGAIMVLPVIPIERFVGTLIGDKTISVAIWASIEELAKLIAVGLVAFGSTYLDEPVDYAMYLIAGALGFAAMENVFFLIHPLQLSHMTVGLITGNLRFLGSTLLHAVASALIGIFLGLAYFEGWLAKKVYLFFGLIGAIALHTVFNFFIMNSESKNIWTTLGFLWVVSIIIILLLEKLKRMKN